MVWAILSESGSGMKDKFIMRPQGDLLETENREPGSLVLSSAESCWFWGVSLISLTHGVLCFSVCSWLSQAPLTASSSATRSGDWQTLHTPSSSTYCSAERPVYGLGLDKVVLCISDFPHGRGEVSDRSNLVEKVYLVHDSEDSIPSH